jgi:hypothetical protein
MSYPRNARYMHLPAIAPLYDYDGTTFAYAFGSRRARLTERTVKITDRREVTIKHAERGTNGSGTLFTIPPKPAETIAKWSSEQVTEIEETFE